MPILELPLPPSVNALWRSNRGRVHRSDHYGEWQTSAGWQLKAQRPARIDGPVEVSIAAGRPDNRGRDADNLPKALLDLLVLHQVIEHDSKAVDIRTRCDTTVPAGRVVIIVRV